MVYSYIIIFLVIFIMLQILKKRKAVTIRNIIKKRKMEDNTKMIELAKRFIGKECVIYSFDNSHARTGVIKEVTNSGLLVDKNGNIEAVNLDFVFRIQEYPRNKKGKKKAVVLD